MNQIMPGRPEEIQCVYSDDLYSGSIYISNVQAAANLETLQRYNIKAVISVARGAFLGHSKEDLPNYLYLPADDNVNFDISQFFDQANSFIQKNRRRTNVLVHCIFGVSRSSAIILAYLIRRYKLTLADAMSDIKRIRPKIRPNSGFVKVLQNYSQTVANAPQIKQVQASKYGRNRFYTVQCAQGNNRQSEQTTRDYVQQQKAKLSSMMSKLKEQNSNMLKRIENLKKKCEKDSLRNTRSITTFQTFAKRKQVSRNHNIIHLCKQVSRKTPLSTNPQNQTVN